MQEPNVTDNAQMILIDDKHSWWQVCGNQQHDLPVVYARGYAATGGRALDGESLARYLQQLAMRGLPSLQAEIPHLNGGWACVVQWSTGELFAAVDRMRTIPIVYYHGPEGVSIATSGDQLAKRYSLPMSRAAEIEFLLFGYVTGSDTLYEGVQQLQPGEMMHYNPAQHELPVTTRYFRFYPTTSSCDDVETLIDELADTFERMFQRFRDGLDGRRVIVPLSGGLDSRLVIAMLKRVGVEDCLCFSYGQGSSEEVRIGRQVAEALGYQWRFFPFSNEVWARWNQSTVYWECLRYVCRGVSRPNLHDFPVVMQLADEGITGEHAIFFPGHSADMNAGSHIPPDYAEMLAGSISPTDHILRKHGRKMWDDPGTLLRAPAAEHLLEKIGQTTTPPENTADDGLARYEMWNAEQRQSKYIINSVRSYDFVGTPWRTLWDYEFMDFFLKVPVELRYGEKLYLETLRRKVFVDDLAALAAIPVANHGELSSLQSVSDPAKTRGFFTKWVRAAGRQARVGLLRAGIPRRRIRKVDSRAVARSRLSGMGIPEGPVSFESALECAGVLQYLDPEVQSALKPSLRTNLDSLSYSGVLAAIVLAVMSQDLQSQTGLREDAQ